MPDHNLSRPAAMPDAAASLGRRPRRRGWWLLALVLPIAAVGALVVARPDLASLMPQRAPAPPPAVEPPPALTVAVAPATMRALARPVVGDGSVVAWQELVVGTEAGGLRVAEMAVEEGDIVRQGQLLVRLDESVPRAQRDQAAAAVEEAEAALRIAEQDLARAVELARSQSVARQILDQRRAAAAQAEARLAAARGSLAEAEAKLAQARILAPTDGVVSRRSALLGAVVPAGQEMVRLIRDGRLEFDARIPELELARVRPGQTVRVTHGERVIEAQVRAIAPVVSSETRLGLVHVALPPDSGLRPGMFARAQIDTGESRGLAVPQEAIVLREGRSAVFVLPEGSDRVVLRPIVTGARHDGMVQVTEGLTAEEPVVVAGAGFLTDGDRVRVADAAREDRIGTTARGDAPAAAH